jgi:hypothetical protein
MSTQQGVYVVFDDLDEDGKRGAEYHFGPYLVAEFSGDALVVTGLQDSGGDLFFILARLGPDGWEVNDGLGTDRRCSKRVRFLAADHKAMVDEFFDGAEAE